MGFSTGILAVCSFKHLWEKKMAFSYCFFVAGAYFCRGSLSWAAGCLRMFLGCFPQGQDCD